MTLCEAIIQKGPRGSMREPLAMVGLRLQHVSVREL